MVQVLKPYKEVDKYSSLERETYYNQIHEICVSRKKHKTHGLFVKLISKLAPYMRNFKIEIRGVENIPMDDTVVFVCNHSNSHDFFVISEVFQQIKRAVSPLAALDGLNFVSRTLFRMAGVTFIRRNNNQSKKEGILELCNKVITGENAFIFGEATWNLHPYRLMQPVKAGAVDVALITGKKIIPTIFEYIEVPHKCKTERELYSKCIVTFGKPISVNTKCGLFEQTQNIQTEMEYMRKNIWKEQDIDRNSVEDIKQDIYINHVYLKKFKAIGFKYNSEYEFQYLLQRNGMYENEYYIDNDGHFVPGISKK